MTTTAYPHDPTGKLASNKIVNERHVLTAKNNGDFQFIVPKFAPFFRESVRITFQPSGSSTTRALVLGKDYYFSHQFMEASKATAFPIYGSITFLNPTIAGVVTLTSYQTLGGDWLIDTRKIQEILADKIHNPRVTSWDQVANLPYRYPVIDHQWNLVDMVGMSEVNTTLNAIERTLRLKTEEAALTVTKDQVGLGNVLNLPILTATNGGRTNNTDNYYVTPKGVRMLIDEVALRGATAHYTNYNNPHRVTAEQVGSYPKAQVFTKAEVNNLLAGYLPIGDTAQNAFKFNNLDPEEYKRQVLTGTASNATALDGLSLDQILERLRRQVIADVNERQGNTDDASTLGGKSLTQIMSDVSNATVANATKFNNKTEAQWLTLIRQQTVAGATRLNGKTEAELTAAIRTAIGTNATTVGGKTVDQIKSEITTAIRSQSNVAATTLGGKTLAQITADTGTQIRNALNQTIARYSLDQIANEVKENLDGAFVEKLNIEDAPNSGAFQLIHLLDLIVPVYADGTAYDRVKHLGRMDEVVDHICFSHLRVNDNAITASRVNNFSGDYVFITKPLMESRMTAIMGETGHLDLQQLNVTSYLTNFWEAGAFERMNVVEKPAFRGKIVRTPGVGTAPATYTLKIYVVTRGVYKSPEGYVGSSSGRLSIGTEGVTAIVNDGAGVPDYQDTLPLIGWQRGGDPVVSTTQMTETNALATQAKTLADQMNTRMTALENYMTHTVVATNGQVNLANGRRMFDLAVERNTTVSITNPPTQGSTYFTIVFCNAGSHVVTWPTNWLWDGGTAPEFEPKALYLINVLGIVNAASGNKLRPTRMYLAKASLMKTEHWS